MTITYRGRAYERDEFERQFNPRAVAKDPDTLNPRRAAMSEAARGRMSGALGVAYGERPRETIDIFPAASGAMDAPALIFFHGGFWRIGSARETSYVAEPFVNAGACVFVVNYDLAPAVAIPAIVAQAKRAIAWVAGHARDHGADPARLYLSGHSAGAHLSAMALADDTGVVPLDAIAGAALISGIFDPEPIRFISVGAELGLTQADAAAANALNHPPRVAIPMIVAAGAAEPEGWVEQSRMYQATAEGGGARVDPIAVPGADHFSIVMDLPDRGYTLTRAMVAMMGLDAG